MTIRIDPENAEVVGCRRASLPAWQVRRTGAGQVSAGLWQRCTSQAEAVKKGIGSQMDDDW
jgi:hypothetical protein